MSVVKGLERKYDLSTSEFLNGNRKNEVGFVDRLAWMYCIHLKVNYGVDL